MSGTMCRRAGGGGSRRRRARTGGQVGAPRVRARQRAALPLGVGTECRPAGGCVGCRSRTPWSSRTAATRPWSPRCGRAACRTAPPAGPAPCSCRRPAALATLVPLPPPAHDLQTPGAPRSFVPQCSAGSPLFRASAAAAFKRARPPLPPCPAPPQDARDFGVDGYTLRLQRMDRKIKLFICVTLYNEDYDELRKTLVGICDVSAAGRRLGRAARGWLGWGGIPRGPAAGAGTDWSWQQ